MFSLAAINLKFTACKLFHTIQMTQKCAKHIDTLFLIARINFYPKTMKHAIRVRIPMDGSVCAPNAQWAHCTSRRVWSKHESTLTLFFFFDLGALKSYSRSRNISYIWIKVNPYWCYTLYLKKQFPQNSKTLSSERNDLPNRMAFPLGNIYAAFL